MPKVLHPHVTSDAAICGGRPHITGTRFSIHRVVEYVLRQGVTPEELRAAFPHLTLGAIYDALAYYYDNRDEVDAESIADAALDAERG
jgi:uncharacterized protein (DUF433 family)